MASFSFLTGIDPNSLPARLRQQMAAPGLIPGPIQPMPLQSGFRAPPAMSMGAMPGMAQPQLQQQPGFNVADGAAMLSKGLAGFKMPKGGGNAGMPEDQNLGNSVSAINALQRDANGQFAPPPMPTDIGSGQGGGGPFAFLGSIPDFLKQWSPPDSSNGLPFLNPSWENFRG